MTAGKRDPAEGQRHRQRDGARHGRLGSQIAYQSAYSGFDVTAYDISDEILKVAERRFAGLAARYELEVYGAAGSRAQAALARIVYSSDLAKAVQDADL